jgi:hypothetical protein
MGRGNTSADWSIDAFSSVKYGTSLTFDREPRTLKGHAQMIQNCANSAPLRYLAQIAIVDALITGLIGRPGIVCGRDRTKSSREGAIAVPGRGAGLNSLIECLQDFVASLAEG